MPFIDAIKVTEIVYDFYCKCVNDHYRLFFFNKEINLNINGNKTKTEDWYILFSVNKSQI